MIFKLFKMCIDEISVFVVLLGYCNLSASVLFFSFQAENG